MIFFIISILSIILNIYFLSRLFKNVFNIEVKTFNELQNFLNVSKPDKLFKRYYDWFEYEYRKEYSLNPNKQDQIITIEFNENYINYHAGKACISDIINNLKFTFKHLLTKGENPELVFKNKSWHLITTSQKIDLSKQEFKNNVVNFHINYIDLKHIAKTVKFEDLLKLSDELKKISSYSNKYIIYDIYNNQFKQIDINVKSWSDYINFCLMTHYSLITSSDDYSIKTILNTFYSISKKYNWLFNSNELKINLYNPKNNEIALPNPDGLIINGHKEV